MNKQTKYLNADKQKELLEASEIIKSGGIVAVPTETVYGLAADARNINAVKEIFTVKNRPPTHPLIVHIASFEQLTLWAKDIPQIAADIARHFWPGPLTLLLNKNAFVNDVVTGGLETIAVRIPQNESLLKILTLLDTGIAAPSANPHKRISPTTAEHVMSGLSGKIDAILDGGPCKVGIESTILDLTGKKLRILRPGPITREMIEKVLGVSIEIPTINIENVPGNMAAHYQPYAQTLLMSLDEIRAHLSLNENQEKLFGVIHYSDFTCTHKNVKIKKMSTNKSLYSRFLYQTLHELDKINPNQILVETPPNKDIWRDVFDRLSKASVINDKRSG